MSEAIIEFERYVLLQWWRNSIAANHEFIYGDGSAGFGWPTPAPGRVVQTYWAGNINVADATPQARLELYIAGSLANTTDLSMASTGWVKNDDETVSEFASGDRISLQAFRSTADAAQIIDCGFICLLELY